MTTEPVVYVVDDDSQARESLLTLLSDSGFHVRGFDSPLQFLSEFDPLQPACLVVDLRMPGLDGTEVQQQLLDRGRVLPTILVTAYGDVPSTVRAMRLGALDVLEKPYRPRALVDRLRSIVTDLRQGRRPVGEAERIRARMGLLTDRERQVCRLLLRGLSAKEIARELGLSHRTAQYHRTRLLGRLEIENERDLFRLGDVISQILG